MDDKPSRGQLVQHYLTHHKGAELVRLLGKVFSNSFFHDDPQLGLIGIFAESDVMVSLGDGNRLIPRSLHYQCSYIACFGPGYTVVKDRIGARGEDLFDKLPDHLKILYVLHQ